MGAAVAASGAAAANGEAIAGACRGWTEAGGAPMPPKVWSIMAATPGFATAAASASRTAGCKAGTWPLGVGAPGAPTTGGA